MATITGIKWPFSFYAGKAALSNDEQHVRESILYIISVAKGEYLLKPDFGCDIHRRVFEPASILALLEGDIRDALAKYEPRIDVLNITVDSSNSHLGDVNVSVNYRLRSQGNLDTVSFVTGNKS